MTDLLLIRFLYMDLASIHVMMLDGISVNIVGQRGISLGDHLAPSHMNAFQVSMIPGLADFFVIM